VSSPTDWLRNQHKRISADNKLTVTAQQAASAEVEGWLKGHGVAYAPPTLIPMSLIDVKRSRNNQARRDPIVNESVDRFAAAMRAGAAFPPIVVYAHGGKLVIVDGNNRHAAAIKSGAEEIYGIVIADDTPSEMIQLLTVEANAHHGVTPELSWRIQQAFHLCGLGFTDAQAAEAASVSVAQIRSSRQIQQAEQRARAMKIVGFADLPASSKQALAVLKEDAVFFQAARVAMDTGMTSEELRDMIRTVKSLPSEGARIEHIGAVAKERGIEAATRRATGKALRRVSSPKTALASGIGLLLKVDTAALVRQVVTTHDRDLLRHRVSELETKVLELMCALDQLKEPEE
jgi:ParB-like chromosome segregation protein Spo0J